MCRVIVQRGPDDGGIFVDGDIVLGVRRLSIIDIAGGHRAIQNEDGTVRVIFNGKIIIIVHCEASCRERVAGFAPKRIRKLSSMPTKRVVWNAYGASMASSLLSLKMAPPGGFYSSRPYRSKAT